MTISIHDLEKYDVLKGLNADLLRVILSFAVYEDFEQGDSLTFEGTEADCFYLIEKGEVSILTEKWDENLPQGEELRAIQNIGEGDVLGWSWIVEPYAWGFTANAVVPVEAIRIDGVKLRAYLEEHPAQGFELLKRFVQMIKDRLIAARMHLALNQGIPFTRREGG